MGVPLCAITSIDLDILVKERLCGGAEPAGFGCGPLLARSPPGLAKGGSGEVKVDGRSVATLRMPHGSPFLFPVNETFDVGLDTRSSAARHFNTFRTSASLAGCRSRMFFLFLLQPVQSSACRFSAPNSP
jgi:hypothetical protein